MFPITTTATRLRARVGHDRNGDPVEDWVTPVRKTYRDVIFYPSASAEARAAGTDDVLDALTVHLPFGDDTVALDRFEVAAAPGVWVVDGSPERWPIKEPGWDYGTVVHLKQLR